MKWMVGADYFNEIGMKSEVELFIVRKRWGANTL